MRQRAMIAMAIANAPQLLIADEPTTALDVTIQAQILEVLKTAQEETHAATILITHDLGLIAELADRVVVMYAGRVVELTDVFTIFNSPRHPYTVGLMNSLPRLDSRRGVAPSDPRAAAEPDHTAAGLRVPPALLHSRGRARCREEMPPLRPFGEGGDHVSACHFAEELGRGGMSRRSGGRMRRREPRRRSTTAARRHGVAPTGPRCSGSRASSSTSRSARALPATGRRRCAPSTAST